jgi:broad specificity polyphosphatase/5'/3'-nucleotidase SurE
LTAQREARGKVDGAGRTEQAVEDEENGHLRYKHKHFKWAPRFKDVFESVEKAPPGNDGWAVNERYVSVTPLRANFMHVDGFEGEVEL